MGKLFLKVLISLHFKAILFENIRNLKPKNLQNLMIENFFLAEFTHSAPLLSIFNNKH